MISSGSHDIVLSSASGGKGRLAGDPNQPFGLLESRSPPMVSSTFMRHCAVVFLGLVLLSISARAASGAEPIVIIKADDFRAPNQAWTNFLKVSRSAGVKVSIGIIVQSIEGKSATADWLKAEAARGDVEFWDHGWDHKSWTDAGKKLTEFTGSGLVHQHEHLVKAQSGLKAALGKDVISLGTPFNGFDSDTAGAINQSAELRLLFTHNLALARRLVNKQVTIIDVISESDGTGKPNAAKFEELWQARPKSEEPVSLQFHPPYFDAEHLAEYTKILDYLKAQHCQIRLPVECLQPTRSSEPAGK
jgi:peptidoglycan/xylan/chitin deacetylase (PgdA/CDA1 family)